MFPLAQVTFLDHSGGAGEPVVVFQSGGPERLGRMSVVVVVVAVAVAVAEKEKEKAYLMDVTDHPLATADLQIREPAFSHQKGRPAHSSST